MITEKNRLLRQLAVIQTSSVSQAQHPPDTILRGLLLMCCFFKYEDH